MSDEWLKFSTEVIDRLSRMETTLTTLDKTVRGNGVPGLVQRVDGLEAKDDVRSGSSATKTRVLAVVISVMLALLSVSVGLSVSHGNKEDAQRSADALYQQKQDIRIQSLEINVAVLMAGLRGPVGPKGKPGAHGAAGPKGDKGGVKLF
jgi:hypothetical protein